MIEAASSAAVGTYFDLSPTELLFTMQGLSLRGSQCTWFVNFCILVAIPKAPQVTAKIVELNNDVTPFQVILKDDLIEAGVDPTDLPDPFLVHISFAEEVV